MRTEKELEPVAERIYWHLERGETSEATRILQSCQKEGLQRARDFVRYDRRKTTELIEREMAALRC